MWIFDIWLHWLIFYETKLFHDSFSFFFILQRILWKSFLLIFLSFFQSHIFLFLFYFYFYFITYRAFLPPILCFWIILCTAGSDPYVTVRTDPSQLITDKIKSKTVLHDLNPEWKGEVLQVKLNSNDTDGLINNGHFCLTIWDWDR